MEEFYLIVAHHESGGGGGGNPFRPLLLWPADRGFEVSNYYAHIVSGGRH